MMQVLAFHYVCTVTSKVTKAHVGDVGHRTRYTKFEVQRPSLPKIWWLIFGHGLSGLVTLTFDLMTLKLVLNVARNTDNLQILVHLQLFFVELWSNASN